LPTGSNSAASQRIPELDGLRGIAIALVLFWHYVATTTVALPGTFLFYALTLGHLTWTGVDLFFVLSGFLIGGILIDAREATNYFRVFYRRRFFRIVPIYATLLTAVPLLLFLAKLSGRGNFTWLTANPLPAFSYWIFAQNFWMVAARTLGANTLGVTWSLAIEEQFYLTFPWIVRFLASRWLIVFVASGIILAPFARGVANMVWPQNRLISFALMPCRADALLLGVLAAIVVRNEVWKRRFETSAGFLRVVIALLACGVGLLAWRSPALENPVMQGFGYTCVAAFYCAILLYALTNKSSAVSWVLRLSWLRWLGGIAYGTYLLHQLVLGLMFGFIWQRSPRLTGVPTILTAVGALALTLLIARASWQYFERPLIQFGHLLQFEFRQRRQELVDAPVSAEVQT
jgi:peptidoglycan/LPS O-acetylase OafA/YrhL